MFSSSVSLADFKRAVPKKQVQKSDQKLNKALLSAPKSVDLTKLHTVKGYFDFISTACAADYSYLMHRPAFVPSCPKTGKFLSDSDGYKKIIDSYMCVPENLFPTEPCPDGFEPFGFEAGYAITKSDGTTKIHGTSYGCAKKELFDLTQAKCSSGFSPGGGILSGYPWVTCGGEPGDGMYGENIDGKCIWEENEKLQPMKPSQEDAAADKKIWDKWVAYYYYEVTTRCCHDKNDLVYSYRCGIAEPMDFVKKDPKDVCQNGYSGDTLYNKSSHAAVCCLLYEYVK